LGGQHKLRILAFNTEGLNPQYDPNVKDLYPHVSVRLTAVVVDHTLLRLLSVQRADGSILRELFDVALPRPHPHPTGHTARRPVDPL
jgi:hypothetical protein